METYLRLSFLKYRYQLGYEMLCVEVPDWLTWLRFCRIPLGERAPHPSTLMRITTRCGSSTVAERNAHRDRGWPSPAPGVVRGPRSGKVRLYEAATGSRLARSQVVPGADIPGIVFGPAGS